MNEREVLARVRAIFDQVADPANLVVPNGDDGAVFSAGSTNVVVASDMAVEEVHFRLSWSSANEIGRKITAANLADICAMGGWPQFLLVSVGFPKTFMGNLEQLAQGICDEARKVGAKVIGGDLSTSDKLVISITAVGATEHIIQRSGAQIGDLIQISHLPGWSAAGLTLLQRGNPESPESSKALAAHRAPEIDYQKYRQAFSALNCATDTSDGLLVDAQNIAEASGCQLALDANAFNKIMGFAELDQLARNLSVDVMDWLLRGGEDHILLVTAKNPIQNFFVIGKVVAGSGVSLDGKEIGEQETGYAHQW
ncbi:MAG: thiamine-phosphate kinase [Candidatus Nanopelagicaceae bacterium]|nr:thiamine-phosphate kinase [Candidatus Nanopelagicaceae bacterium]